MPGIFLATGATTAPPPPVVLPSGMDMSWTGWDGSRWDLTSLDSPVYLGRGVIGTGRPPMEFYTDDLTGMDGTMDRGFRVKAREVFWPVRVNAPAGDEWINVDSSFWDTLLPGRYGTWTVAQQSGLTRTLRLRLDTDGDDALDIDPSLLGYATYGVNLLAPDPFWRGDPVVRTWSSGVGEPFFGGTSGGNQGPPFVISPSATIATARMTNPGDVPEWPVWTVFGPTNSVTLGLNGRLIQVPFTIADGAALIVDTHPTAQTAFNATVSMVNGQPVATATTTERTGDLGATNYAPIPPGASVSLSLAMAGTGSISASLTPGYLRAW